MNYTRYDDSERTTSSKAGLMQRWVWVAMPSISRWVFFGMTSALDEQFRESVVVVRFTYRSKSYRIGPSKDQWRIT